MDKNRHDQIKHFKELESYSQGYALLGKLFLGPYDKSLIIKAEQLPYLSESLKRAYPAAKCDEAMIDAVGSDHYELFGRQIYPFESFYLSPDAKLGSTISSRVHTFYDAYSFKPDELASDSPDHFGMELLFIGFLIRQEVRALKTEDTESAEKYRKVQVAFLSEHLLHWLYPFVVSVREYGCCFFKFLTEVAFELTLEHWRYLIEVQGNDALLPKADGEAAESFDPQEFMNDPKTDFKKISKVLMRPHKSGMVLSHKALDGMTESFELPRIFSQREPAFKRLLETAVEYDKLSEVLAGLDACIEKWNKNYHSVPEELKPFTEPWIARLAKSRKVIEAMQKASPSNGENQS
ncbi:MAG: molecular chaperone TorD family protein [Chlorobiales bacterium]|jgi:putative dimethyl sulfoxide reductase chaperone|nr:molecular chaperone TorD family protein [Chlorobiales bacterium]